MGHLKNKRIFFLLFLIFDFVFAQNQTVPSVVLPPTVIPTSPPAAVSTESSTPVDKKESNSTDSDTKIGAKPVSAGKYQEHQSICTKNEYDIVAYYSTSLKESRITSLKLKMADEVDRRKLIKIELLLAKEYIDQREKNKFTDLVGILKTKKLETSDNEFLNALIAFFNANYSTARTILNKMLNVNSNDVSVLTLLAEVYLAEQNFYEAGTIYEDLNKTTKNAYLIEYCQTLVLNFFNADGEKFCLQAADKFPENPLPLIFIGITHRERSDLAKAQQFFKKAIEIKPTEMGRTCLAETFLMKENYSEALQLFKKSTDINPKSERAILGLAWTELKLKNYDESLSAFKKACKLNGKNEFELRRAYKVLNADKVPEAKKFIALSDFCGG